VSLRDSVAATVFGRLIGAAKKAGAASVAAERFVMRQILFPDPNDAHEVGHHNHNPGARRRARQRQKSSRQEQRRKGIYRSAL